jgi:3-deoxy-D-manno-octulosonic-acid transferase
VEKLLGERVAHCYAPYDFPDAVSRFFERLAPRMLVLMETELWPNMLEQARARSVPALLVNARLSERSARGYARVGALTRRMLDSLDFVACQYPDHADRFAALGAARERLDALGSVKFDVSLPADHEPRCAELAARWNLTDRPVWIAASTHPGEEALVLEAHQRIRSASPDAVLILVPRHPNRADEVERLIGEAGFDCTRMSASVSMPVGICPGEVILGDTMGELLYLYGLSQVAFVGGSLVPVGGHNPIEAAVCGQPLVMGPELRNFADVAAAFRAAGCLELVDGAQELAAVVGGYLSSPTRRSAAAGSALAVVAANTGATERLFQLLRARLDGL